MNKVYAEQPDGSLKPVTIPDTLAQKVDVYRQLTDTYKLSLEEIKWLCQEEPWRLTKD